MQRLIQGFAFGQRNYPEISGIFERSRRPQFLLIVVDAGPGTSGPTSHRNSAHVLLPPINHDNRYR
jgi:hypothetical protein